MASTFKAQAHLRQLVDDLKKQLTNLPVCVESFDSNSNPVATFSADTTPAAGEKVIVLRVKPIGVIGAQNIIGQTAEQFSHHVIQICTEANYAGASDNVADVLSAADLLPVLIEAGRRGSFVEWYQTASGTVPSVSAIDSGSPAGTWRDLYWNVLKAS